MARHDAGRLEAFRDGGKPVVVPIIQIILSRAPDAARKWVDVVTSWDFQRVPAHFETNLAVKPKELRQAFAFLDEGKNSVRFCDEDVAFLREALDSLPPDLALDTPLGPLRGKACGLERGQLADEGRTRSDTRWRNIRARWPRCGDPASGRLRSMFVCGGITTVSLLTASRGHARFTHGSSWPCVQRVSAPPPQMDSIISCCVTEMRLSLRPSAIGGGSPPSPPAPRRALIARRRRGGRRGARFWRRGTVDASAAPCACAAP